MADQKLSQLVALTSPDDGDLVYTVHDIGNEPSDRKITFGNIKAWLTGIFVEKRRLTLGSNPTAINCAGASRVNATATYTASTTLTFSNVANLDDLAMQITNTNANTITFAGLTFQFKDSELPDGVSFATNALTFPADSAVKYNIVGVRFDGTNMRAKIEIN